jgi:hypothetical protein
MTKRVLVLGRPSEKVSELLFALETEIASVFSITTDGPATELLAMKSEMMQEASLVAFVIGRGEFLNPNVMFELGLAIGGGRLVIVFLLDSSDAPMPSATGQLRYFRIGESDWPEKPRAIVLRELAEPPKTRRAGGSNEQRFQASSRAEDAVLETLLNSNNYEVKHQNRGADFIAREISTGCNLVIEVKSSARQLNVAQISRLFSSQSADAEHFLIVVLDGISTTRTIIGDTTVQILSFEDFRSLATAGKLSTV